MPLTLLTQVHMEAVDTLQLKTSVHLSNELEGYKVSQPWLTLFQIHRY